jgi:hypothetical protein
VFAVTARAPLQAGSQCDKLLAHLSRGYRITDMQALRKWGVRRLAARIYDLRRRQHQIIGALVHRNGKSYAVYWLDTRKHGGFQ